MKDLLSKYTKEQFYRAHLTRDYRFDGRFFVAVHTTKIYCRPVCPARKAKLENLTFYLHAILAENDGFRPCMRCRPESAPGSSAWIGTSAVVRRAIRLMESNTFNIQQLVEQLGLGERWFRDLFTKEIGMNPQAYLLNQKLALARQLIDSTNPSMTEIAFQSGFQSIRRFNDAFKKKFKASPSAFKAKSTACHAEQFFYIRYRPPYDWQKLVDFFAFRAISGTENVTADLAYERLVIFNGVQGWIHISLAEKYQIKIQYRFEKPIPMFGFVARVKILLDSDADPMLIEKDLKQDKKLAKLLKKSEGLRIPGAINCFEIAVRAIIGQKISVKAARTILTRLTNLCGQRQRFDTNISLTTYFPTADDILKHDLSGLGLTKSKIESLTALAKAIVKKEICLDGTADFDGTCQKLQSIKGIGPWTVEYIAMRGLRNPNAFPATDLELKKKIKKYQLNPDLWCPWRSYAAIFLFSL